MALYIVRKLDLAHASELKKVFLTFLIMCPENGLLFKIRLVYNCLSEVMSPLQI